VGAARSDDEWVAAFVLTCMSVGAIALGIRIFCNGFLEIKAEPPRQ
jgi:hypothetical protein